MKSITVLILAAFNVFALEVGDIVFDSHYKVVGEVAEVQVNRVKYQVESSEQMLSNFDLYIFKENSDCLKSICVGSSIKDHYYNRRGKVLRIFEDRFVEYKDTKYGQTIYTRPSNLTPLK